MDPVRARAGRTPQELFVNRRPIKNSTIQHAVIDGYSAFLAKGHAPLFVLFLDIDPQRVDVNVHPTKREVRFASTEQIHQLVRSAVRQALGRAQVQASLTGSAHARLNEDAAMTPSEWTNPVAPPARESFEPGHQPPASPPSQTSFVGKGLRPMPWMRFGKLCRLVKCIAPF
ncbi:MAG: hypothetical protein MRJ92_11465 [Nitrospira sp.]|nr:hypothetical protein [Nitrospira sp.]